MLGGADFTPRFANLPRTRPALPPFPQPHRHPWAGIHPSHHQGLRRRELASREDGTARVRQGWDRAHSQAHLLKLACLHTPATWVQVLACTWPRGTRNLIAAASACRETHIPVGQRPAARATGGPLWWRACAARTAASGSSSGSQRSCKRPSGAALHFSATEHIYIILHSTCLGVYFRARFLIRASGKNGARFFLLPYSKSFRV